MYLTDRKPRRMLDDEAGIEDHYSRVKKKHNSHLRMIYHVYESSLSKQNLSKQNLNRTGNTFIAPVNKTSRQWTQDQPPPKLDLSFNTQQPKRKQSTKELLMRYTQSQQPSVDSSSQPRNEVDRQLQILMSKRTSEGNRNGPLNPANSTNVQFLRKNKLQIKLRLEENAKKHFKEMVGQSKRSNYEAGDVSGILDVLKADAHKETVHLGLHQALNPTESETTILHHTNTKRNGQQEDEPYEINKPQINTQFDDTAERQSPTISITPTFLKESAPKGLKEIAPKQSAPKKSVQKQQVPKEPVGIVPAVTIQPIAPKAQPAKSKFYQIASKPTEKIPDVPKADNPKPEKTATVEKMERASLPTNQTKQAKRKQQQPVVPARQPQVEKVIRPASQVEKTQQPLTGPKPRKESTRIIEAASFEDQSQHSFDTEIVSLPTVEQARAPLKEKPIKGIKAELPPQPVPDASSSKRHPLPKKNELPPKSIPKPVDDDELEEITLQVKQPIIVPTRKSSVAEMPEKDLNITRQDMPDANLNISKSMGGVEKRAPEPPKPKTPESVSKSSVRSTVPKKPTEEQLNDYIGNITKHEDLVAVVGEYVGKARKAYDKVQFNWYSIAYVLYGKFVFERERVKNSLLGKANCFTLKNLEVPDHALKYCLEDEEVTQLRDQLVTQSAKTYECLSQYYQKALSTDKSIKQLGKQDPLQEAKKALSIEYKFVSTQAGKNRSMLLRKAYLIELLFVLEHLAGGYIKDHEDQTDIENLQAYLNTYQKVAERYLG